MLLTVTPSMAQTSTTTTVNDSGNNDPLSVYARAENLYDRGYFISAEQELLACVRQLRGMHKTSAYRLLALCAFERGDHENAKKYVDLLLKSDPYYTVTLNDPRRLRDLIAESKSQSAGITTASRQAESVEEAPVPVTVITEEMIRFSGATSVQELLCLYVPGMSYIEGTDANIAMHGIYGLNQDKILFLQDGHRLNGSSTNAESADFRNSLDKIQQIEVLRGAASSLYGNVALTAVVNIITRKGAVLNGGRVNATVGTLNTFGGSFVVGGGNNVVDVLGWGSINSTDGAKHEIMNPFGGVSRLYSGAYNKRPSYDIGIKARWGDFSMTVASQRSKKTPYTNILQVSATQTAIYDYDQQGIGGYYMNSSSPDYGAISNFNADHYEMVGSNGPGVTRTNHHINLDYSHSFGNIDLQASGYISMENTSLYNAMGDSIDQNIGYMLMVNTMKNMGIYYSELGQETIAMALFVNTKDVYQVLDWENISIGGQAQMLAKYNFLGHGSAVLGVQYDHFALTDGSLSLGGQSSTGMHLSLGTIFQDGMEDIISGYTQIKHYFGDRFIINAGLRYDHKIRFNGEKLNHLSPRASVIYKFSDALSGRVGYNYSIVDAPFLYRASNVSMFSGGENMKPESMKSYQLGFTYHKPNSAFLAEVCGFYNSLSNLINQSLTMSTGHLFLNAGKVKQTGVDASVQYSVPRFFINANGTWQKVLSSSKYNVEDGNRFGIPAVMGRVTAAWMPYRGKGHGFFDGGKLWINVNSSVQSKTYYQTVDLLSSMFYRKLFGEVSKVPAQFIVGAGVTYEWKHLDLSFMAKNITNNQYMVGSVLSAGIPYTGRELLGKLTIKF